MGVRMLDVMLDHEVMSSQATLPDGIRALRASASRGVTPDTDHERLQDAVGEKTTKRSAS